MAKKKTRLGTINKFEIKNLKLKIYILHGWSYSVEKWAPFIKELESKGFDSKLLKIPGLTEKNDRVWDIGDYVTWLDENLKKEKGKIILIGHSNGGRIALNFAIKHPEKISKLILIDSAGIYHSNAFTKTKRTGFLILAKIGKKIMPLTGARKLLYLLTGEKDYETASPIMKKTMLNLIQSDKSLLTEKVKVPTIIIWGENDKATPLSDGKILNGKIKNSKLYVIDGAKHAPQFTHTKEVLTKIYEHI
ncbi:MAG: alpha/beta hydrolase [Patescibacteria group bacterium]|nr:alpha/beta hydrolase [Patescibacteria group bacterium]